MYGNIAGTIPLLSPIIKKCLYAITPYSPSVIGKVTRERVHERLAELSSASEAEDGKDSLPRQDMLTGFINAKYPHTSTPVEPSEVIALATSVISAGSDTTAIALTAFFYFILTHPATYDRVQAEVDAAYERGLVSDKDRGLVSYAEGVKLEYLQACFKEAMRLMPPFAMDMLRVVPSEGLLLRDNLFLPPGTEVGANAFVFNRSKGAFGDDAEIFRPDRWLELPPNERAALERNFLSVSTRASGT